VAKRSRLTCSRPRSVAKNPRWPNPVTKRHVVRAAALAQLVPPKVRTRSRPPLKFRFRYPPAAAGGWRPMQRR
jgi:hypothetical protein